MIRLLSRFERDDAVDVLFDACYDYPVMHFVINDDSPAYEPKLRKLLSFLCDVRFTRDNPVVGLFEKKELIGVALTNPPDYSSLSIAIEAGYSNLSSFIGEDAIRRLHKYELCTRHHKPETPHYYIGLFAVRKDFRGMGHGQNLMNFIFQLSEKDPHSGGVAFNSERNDKLQYYQEQGFEITGELPLDNIISWGFYRQNQSA